MKLFKASMKASVNTFCFQELSTYSDLSPVDGRFHLSLTEQDGDRHERHLVQIGWSET